MGTVITPLQYRFVFFCPRDTESLLLHKQNPFFAIDRDHYRRPQTIKTQTDPSGYICKAAPTPKAQGILENMGQKNCRSQRTREFAVRFCLLPVSEATLTKLITMTA